MITDMLPRYRESLQFVTDRIDKLRAEQKQAIAEYRWCDADVLRLRMIALYDTRLNLLQMIKEIEQHGP